MSTCLHVEFQPRKTSCASENSGFRNSVFGTRHTGSGDLENGEYRRLLRRIRTELYYPLKRNDPEFNNLHLCSQTEGGVNLTFI